MTRNLYILLLLLLLCDNMIEEIEMNGFWYGKPKKYYSKNQNGEMVILSKKEYEQMLTNGEVIVFE